MPPRSVLVRIALLALLLLLLSTADVCLGQAIGTSSREQEQNTRFVSLSCRGPQNEYEVVINNGLFQDRLFRVIMACEGAAPVEKTQFVYKRKQGVLVLSPPSPARVTDGGCQFLLESESSFDSSIDPQNQVEPFDREIQYCDGGITGLNGNSVRGTRENVAYLFGPNGQNVDFDDACNFFNIGCQWTRGTWAFRPISWIVFSIVGSIIVTTVGVVVMFILPSIVDPTQHSYRKFDSHNKNILLDFQENPDHKLSEGQLKQIFQQLSREEPGDSPATLSQNAAALWGGGGGGRGVSASSSARGFSSSSMSTQQQQQQSYSQRRDSSSSSSGTRYFSPKSPPPSSSRGGGTGAKLETLKRGVSNAVQTLTDGVRGNTSGKWKKSQSPQSWQDDFYQAQEPVLYSSSGYKDREEEEYDSNRANYTSTTSTESPTIIYGATSQGPEYPSSCTVDASSSPGVVFCQEDADEVRYPGGENSGIRNRSGGVSQW